MFSFPIILTMYAGFSHAFETDHLLAVSNIVTSRDKTVKAVKDGMYWGLGHSSTILIVGIIVLLLRLQISENYFHYFEALVGVMLIVLGIYRLYKWWKERKVSMHVHKHIHTDSHKHSQIHVHQQQKKHHEHSHFPAYNIGLIHGLAGSGSLMILVMSQAQSVSFGLIYLLIFGFGSVAGMMVAAGAFSLPFSQKILQISVLQLCLVSLSAGLCIVYGGWVVYQNLA